MTFYRESSMRRMHNQTTMSPRQFVPTGEVRAPRKGEWYVGKRDEAYKAIKHCSAPSAILRMVAS